MAFPKKFWRSVIGSNHRLHHSSHCQPPPDEGCTTPPPAVASPALGWGRSRSLPSRPPGGASALASAGGSSSQSPLLEFNRVSSVLYKACSWPLKKWMNANSLNTKAQNIGTTKSPYTVMLQVQQSWAHARDTKTLPHASWLNTAVVGCISQRG